MAISNLLLATMQVFIWLLLARVILSWVNPNPRNELLLLVFKITEPILAPLRGVTNFGGFDWSPLVALLLIRVIMSIIA
jgi:YggT family protein